MCAKNCLNRWSSDKAIAKIKRCSFLPHMGTSIYFMTYFPAPISSIMSRVWQLVITHCRQFVCSEIRSSAQRATVEHEQLTGQLGAPRKLRHTRCRWPDLTCLSMDVRDCVRYTNTLKHFIRLRNSSKNVTARFSTWNPGNWHEN